MCICMYVSASFQIRGKRRVFNVSKLRQGVNIPMLFLIYKDYLTITTFVTIFLI